MSNSATETLAKSPGAGLGRPGHLVKRDIEENPLILLMCGRWVSVYVWIPGNHLMAVRITSLRYRLRELTTSGMVLSPNFLFSGILDFPSSRHFSLIFYRCSCECPEQSSGSASFHGSLPRAFPRPSRASPAGDSKN